MYTEQADFDEGGNESCYAYMLEYGETKVLYTGDMQLATERKLLDEYGEDELDDHNNDAAGKQNGDNELHDLCQVF